MTSYILHMTPPDGFIRQIVHGTLSHARSRACTLSAHYDRNTVDVYEALYKGLGDYTTKPLLGRLTGGDEWSTPNGVYHVFRDGTLGRRRRI